MGEGSIAELEQRAARAETGSHELERIRQTAQLHAYQDDEPEPARLRWARLSLAANRRTHGDGPWGEAGRRLQEFMLRTWVITRLGPGDEPEWHPEALAADTLVALALHPSEAAALAEGWRDLPVERIGELRRHKNLTAHLATLLPLLPAGPTKTRLLAWNEIRAQLP
ncbi:hypothetical protein [Kitasatospora sp. NPDC058190]|uniref:hypothetical protein n=1 Tax=Kitasatospora sp. NPDC058190 TaxID=3346371 RepID=UPI0036D9B4D0